jgi:predicted AAA+ superfamily ATPase
MERYINQYIKRDLPEKIVFITGPRQVGKTTLAKSLSNSYDYFNYDLAEHRIAIKECNWDRNKELVIFDELHKMNQWKRWLKGIYDTDGIPPQMLVTGSAKLNTYRKVGDSLAGRYFQYRLHPFDIKESKNIMSPEEAFARLWNCSGFPEPFLKNSQTYYRRWRRSHIDIILRQDLLDLRSIRDIKAIETMLLLLQQNVGSTISYSNLARSLEKDTKTIKAWLQLLEDLYIIFKVTPYSKRITRSLLKEPKYYFYDFVLVDDNKGAKLENIVACALLKELQFLEDIHGINTNLHFLKTKDGKEIDFLVLINERPVYVIEVKWADDNPSKNFEYFANILQPLKKVQLVKDIKRDKTYPDGLEVRSVSSWLANLSFEDNL